MTGDSFLQVAEDMVCSDNSSENESGLECCSTGSREGDTDEEEGLTGKDHSKSSDGAAMEVALSIYNARFALAVAWPIAAVLMAPFAYFLVLNVQPLPHDPPHGTPSNLAEDFFKAKFPYLVGMKMESVVFKCRTPCDTAVSQLSQGYVQQVKDLVEAFGHQQPGTIIDVRSYYSFGTKIDENPMLSYDKQSILLVWSWRVNNSMKFAAEDFVYEMKKEIDIINRMQPSGPGAYDVEVSGPTFLNTAMKDTIIREVPVHEISTIWLPFSILAYRLRSVRMLLLALCSMPICILISFGFMYFVSLYTTVILYSVVMMLLLCTALSFDYSLFTLTRYGEERSHGVETKEAILIVITQSGHVVVVSGIVLTIAYAAMLVLPGAFKTFCVAACSMILCCLGVQLTFVPSLLAIFPWFGAGFEPEDAEREVLEDDYPQKVHAPKQQLGESSPKDPLSKATPHRQGIWYYIGGKVTRFPLNLLIPVVVYGLTSPLTWRMTKYKMGHAYELQIPRGRREWDTSLYIQKHFPSSVGCMMPTLIIASNKLPANPPPNDYMPNAVEAIFGPPRPHTAVNLSLPVPGSSATDAPLDVRGQAFFDANCQMVDSLIKATQNRTVPLRPTNFQSPTIDPRNKLSVECLSYRATSYFRESYFTQKFMFTSHLMQELWDQLVSQKHDAMLTVLSTKLDPFSSEAFALTGNIRQTLENVTEAQDAAKVSGVTDVTYMMFSASAIIMDMIDVTSSRLPYAFLGCAIVCFSVIAVSFKAALIPFKLMFTVILPITWTYGAALYVYEDGILEWTGFPGLQPTYIDGVPAGIDWTVPMFTLTIMLGLALDYDVFLFERVYEFREEGFGDKEAIQLGLSATGPIISAAGLIFGFTFVSMLLGSIAVPNQMGFIYVCSILIDTFIVRTVLTPAMLSLNPCLNYWPSRMPKPRYTWIGQSE